VTNLIIIEKYEMFLNYTYPILQNIERKHGVVKHRTIELLFNQVDLFYKSIKSNQISKLYEADSNLSSIRFHLRFLTDVQRFKGNLTKNRGFSQKQHTQASILLNEVGAILNSWIKNKR